MFLVQTPPAVTCAPLPICKRKGWTRRADAVIVHCCFAISTLPVFPSVDQLIRQAACPLWLPVLSQMIRAFSVTTLEALV